MATGTCHWRRVPARKMSSRRWPRVTGSRSSALKLPSRRWTTFSSGRCRARRSQTMHKFWVVAKHEYLKITRKRSFLLGTLAMPLFFVGIMALAIVVVVAGEDQRPIGYVDEAGLLTTVTTLPASEDDGPTPVELRAFGSEAQARAALEAKEIQAYYVLPADYLTSHQAQLFYWEKEPNNSAQRRFNNLVRANLTTAFPAEVAKRAQQGIN